MFCPAKIDFLDLRHTPNANAMKKTLLLAALALGIFASCKKHNPAGGTTNFGSYHLTATIDGKNLTFNANLAATKVTSSGETSVAITGYTGQSGSNIPGLGLT